MSNITVLSDLLTVPGTRCTLNRQDGIFMDFEAREFIGATCVVVKRTKAGLIKVALESDFKRTY